MAFSSRNIAGCFLKITLQRGVMGAPGLPLATPLVYREKLCPWLKNFHSCPLTFAFRPTVQISFDIPVYEMVYLLIVLLQTILPLFWNDLNLLMCSFHQNQSVKQRIKLHVSVDRCNVNNTFPHTASIQPRQFQYINFPKCSLFSNIQSLNIYVFKITFF